MDKGVDMTILEKIRSKLGIQSYESGETTSPAAGYTEGNQESEELSPLDIIKQDTDVFSDEATYVFTLPTPSLDISDYFAHFLIPAEDIKGQSVRRIQ
jgi:hypothetical protein